MPDRSGRVVITGASGYIATSLAKCLVAEGHRLLLVSRRGSAAEIEYAPDNGQERAFLDLESEPGWESALDGASAVVHLSGRTELRAAEADETLDAKLNVEPVRSLLRVALRRKGPRLPVIFASAATIVGDRHENPVDEDTPDNPISVYDRHKLLCERMLLSAAKDQLINACILRLSNVYGHGVSSKNRNRGVLNQMLRRAAEGRPVTVYGDGNYVRDFVHIDDVVDAFARSIVLATTHGAERFLVASGEGRTMRDALAQIAEEAQRITGKTVSLRHVPEPSDTHPIERRNFIGDSTRLSRKTGWRPVTSFSAGICASLRRIVAEPSFGGTSF